jgi:putative ABC transport system permease protein
MLTVLVVAAVVAVFVWMLGFAAAMSRSLAMAGEADKIIVLRAGASSESNSAIPVEDVNKLTQLTDVAHDTATGEALISPETMVQVSLPRTRDHGATQANVAVRGVTPIAFKVHRNVKPESGVFEPGSPQVIVGKTAAAQFQGLNVGDEIRLGYGGNRAYKVVGLFSADGGPMESEIWGYAPALQNDYNRSLFSAVSLRVAEGADPQAVIRQIEGPAIQLSAHTEAAYWQEQVKWIRLYLRIAAILVAVMCVAAVFSIANAMYSAVAGRTREIAMLRAIGFNGRQILTGFLTEAVLLSLLGGLVGCVGCLTWLKAVGSTKDMFGAHTFTTLAFNISLTPEIVLTALVAVSAVGVLGALAPARRAARLDVVTALRQP